MVDKGIVKFTLLIPEYLDELIEKAMRQTGMATKNEFIRDAIRRRLEELQVTAEVKE